MKNMILATTALCAMAGAANANIFFETEVNNTIPQANPIGTYGFPGDSVLVDGRIVPGDVDWFRIVLTGQTRMVAAAFALPASTFTTDGQLMVVDSSNAIVAFDDDNNIGFMPSLEVTLGAGTYYIGISGFDDGNAGGPLQIFDGLSTNGRPHTQDWRYKLVIGMNIPTPAGAAVLGLMGLGMGLRRRR